MAAGRWASVSSGQRGRRIRDPLPGHPRNDGKALLAFLGVDEAIIQKLLDHAAVQASVGTTSSARRPTGARGPGAVADDACGTGAGGQCDGGCEPMNVQASAVLIVRRRPSLCDQVHRGCYTRCYTTQPRELQNARNLAFLSSTEMARPGGFEPPHADP